MRTPWLCLVVVLPMATASAAPMNDLRTLRIGTAAAAMPVEGFSGFACAASPDTPLAGWQDWTTCPADPAGRHAVRFRYAEGDTRVAGHPVLLTALFDGAGRLAGLDIVTDPAAPLFLRKKAFLLGLQARARYGEDGWSCVHGKPDANDEPIGSVFVEETCRKHADGRDIVVSRSLLRHPGTDLKAFVGESRIDITAASP